MWSLDENESNINPWNIDEENDATHDNLNVGRVEPVRSQRSQIDDFFAVDTFEKKIVQVYVFRGISRYDDFNDFVEENDIGEDDIVSIADNEDRLVLFYLK